MGAVLTFAQGLLTLIMAFSLGNFWVMIILRERVRLRAQGAREAPVQHTNFPRSGDPGLFWSHTRECHATAFVLLPIRRPELGAGHHHPVDRKLCQCLWDWILRVVE